MTTSSTPARPTILTLRVATGSPEAHSNPTLMYTREAADRAIGRLGRDGYTVLRTKMFHGLQGQRAAIDTVLGPLEAAIADAAAVEADDEPARYARMSVEFLGLETHWHSIHRVGQAVESLCALIDALDRYRAGSTAAEVSRRLVRHDLDLQRVLQSKKARKLGYWETLGGRPTREALAKAGMTEAESRDLLAESRTWAGKMLRRFKLISDFYTSPLHQVYAKYRHGYTIVNPTFSPLNVMLDGRNAREVEAAIEGGLVVMHEAADGRRVIHVVKTGVPEIRVCLDFARFVIDVTRSVATAWLIEVEHPEHRTIAFDTLKPWTVAKWLGTGLDDVYDISNQILHVDIAEPVDS